MCMQSTVNDTHVDRCFPFWKPCSRCLGTDDTWAWGFPPHRPHRTCKKESRRAQAICISQGPACALAHEVRECNSTNIEAPSSGRDWQHFFAFTKRQPTESLASVENNIINNDKLNDGKSHSFTCRSPNSQDDSIRKQGLWKILRFR